MLNDTTLANPFPAMLVTAGSEFGVTVADPGLRARLEARQAVLRRLSNQVPIRVPLLDLAVWLEDRQEAAFLRFLEDGEWKPIAS